jgi:hypothetical protein
VKSAVSGHRFVAIVRVKRSGHDAKHTGNSCSVSAGAVPYETLGFEKKGLLKQLFDWNCDLMRTFPATLRGAGSGSFAGLKMMSVSASVLLCPGCTLLKDTMPINYQIGSWGILNAGSGVSSVVWRLKV